MAQVNKCLARVQHICSLQQEVYLTAIAIHWGWVAVSTVHHRNRKTSAAYQVFLRVEDLGSADRLPIQVDHVVPVTDWSRFHQLCYAVKVASVQERMGFEG